MINEKIYNWKLTKEEEEYLQGQLKRYREEKARERAKDKILQLVSEIDLLCSDYNLNLFYDGEKFDSDNLYLV